MKASCCISWQLDLESSLDGLDRMFEGEQSEVTRAYALSGALVHDLLQRHGAETGAKILTRMNEGASFEHAFSETVGMTPDDAESEFWSANIRGPRGFPR